MTKLEVKNFENLKQKGAISYIFEVLLDVTELRSPSVETEINYFHCIPKFLLEL